jgi:phosphoglycolate phosphatase
VKYRCVIFDWDGTLADSVADFTANVNRVLKERGFPPAPVEAFIKMQGQRTEPQILKLLPPEAQSEKLAAELSQRITRLCLEVPLNLVTLYPGARELVAELGHRKLKRAVLSNKPQAIVSMETAGLYAPGSFEAVYGTRPETPCKPNPAPVWELLTELDVNPADVIFAGDSAIDMEAACAAGCFALGVSWGYWDVEVLKAAGAKHIINRPEELLELL